MDDWPGLVSVALMDDWPVLVSVSHYHCFQMEVLVLQHFSVALEIEGQVVDLEYHRQLQLGLTKWSFVLKQCEAYQQWQ